MKLAQSISLLSTIVASVVRVGQGQGNEVNLALGGKDLAYGGKPYMSSRMWEQSHWNGNNGNTNDLVNTDHEHQPYWRVELPWNSTISTVIVWNRVDCCQGRLSNSVVNVFDSNFNTVASRSIGVVDGNTDLKFEFDLNGVVGKTVEVKKTGTGTLNLAEVEVWGVADTNTDNLARAGTASQSSNHPNGCCHAETAIDGIRTYPTATDFEDQPWWRVELPQVSTINKVVVWNRADFYQFRLSNSVVNIRDSNMNIVDSRNIGVIADNSNMRGATQQKFEFDFNGAMGKIVEVQSTQTNAFMSIAEVEVYGTAGGSADATGDPHFITWSGKKYDFHGVCDLVLIENPEFEQGLGLHIHVRTKQLKQFSYISSAVLRIGHESLEVMGDMEENLYWINKQPGKNEDNGIVGFVNGYAIGHKKLNLNQHEFTVSLPDNASIQMKTFKKFVHVSMVNTSIAMFGSSRGLFGTYGSSSELISRDNKKVFEDINQFGQEWQVLPSDGMLFHNVEGPQAPAEKCEIPATSNIRRRLLESDVSEEEAKIYCANVEKEVFELCVFDVMATNDKDVVGAY